MPGLGFEKFVSTPTGALETSRKFGKSSTSSLGKPDELLTIRSPHDKKSGQSGFTEERGSSQQPLWSRPEVFESAPGSLKERVNEDSKFKVVGRLKV
jgi:hypothetical protein